jgi:flagellar basal-body rod modification protein FlgD
MTDIAALSGAAATASSSDAFSRLSTQDFRKVIFAELGRQDPLEPSDTSALLEQISTLRSIQSDMDLASRLESIAAQSELTGAGSLLGRLVGGVAETGERAVDIVISVSRTPRGAVLNLASGQRVPMSGVDEVVDMDALSALDHGAVP